MPVACSDLPVLREVGGELPHYFDPRRSRGGGRGDRGQRSPTMPRERRGPSALRASRGRPPRAAPDAAYERALARWIDVHVGLNLVFLVPGETGGMEVAARELIPALRRGGARRSRFTAFVNREAAAAGRTVGRAAARR